ncbi:restriction endonuclease subunit S [Vibrio casei]|uniref:restriction endonuclease subunit S n=1 Tax=Vibrio casei TaxID=673372 RepID=UPI003F9E3311
MSNMVPDRWEIGSFSDFATINPKLTSDVTLTPELKVSFIKMEDVSNDAQVKKMHVRNYVEVSKGFTKFNDHDVLVAKITPCFENGKGGYVEHLVNGIGFGSTEFHVLRAKKNTDSKYIYQYTNYDSFRLAAEASMCGTGGQRRVQTDFMKTHKVIFPPLPEQKKIAAILTSVDEVIEKTQAQIDKLKDLKTALMQDLLTGKVRVKVD